MDIWLLEWDAMLGVNCDVWRATLAIRNNAVRPRPASQMFKLLMNEPLVSPMVQRRFDVVKFFLFIALTVSVQAALALQLVELNEDNALVVEMRVEDLELSETLIVFQQPESTLIPLQPLAGFLDFPLRIDAAEKSVNGWFINESNTFSIDLDKQTLFIRGEQLPWPENFAYAADDFDLYFDYRLLERWFGLRIQLNVSRLMLKVSADDELPIVQQERRRLMQQRLDKVSQESRPEHYLANDYQWLGNPAFDLELGGDIQGNHGQINAHAGSVLQGRMDLLKHSMQVSYINAASESDLRLTFSRAEPAPDEHLWLGLTEYELGDTRSGSDSLMFSSVKGRGTRLSRSTGAGLDQVDEVIIEGDAPPGWEVELYRNGALLAFATSGANGRYEFTKIPMFVGQNIFEIRIYGPQGQFRTRREEINIGPGMIKAKEWAYRLDALQNNAQVLSLGDSSSDTSLDPSSDQAATDFYLGEVSYGLNDYLTLQASAVKLTPQDSDTAHYYHSVETFTSLAGIFSHLKFVEDIESGSAYAAVFKGKWADLNYNVDLLKFNGLVSDRNPNGLKSNDIKFGVSGFTRVLDTLPLSYDFEINDTGFRNPEWHQTAYSNRLSSNLFSANIAHDIRFITSTQDQMDEQIDGKLSANKRFSRWRLKTELDYALSPRGRINGLGSSATWNSMQDVTYQVQMNYVFTDDDELSLSNTLTWGFDYLSLSLSADVTSNGSQAIGLSLNTSFGYDRAQDRLLMSKDSLSSTGSATAKVYLDRNHDGAFNEPDTPIEGATFKGRSAWRKHPTDVNGVTSLHGIPPKESQLIEIDEASLGDPFLRPSKNSQYLYTHAGGSSYIEFPVIETFEIEGSIVVVGPEGERVIRGIPIQLLNGNNEIVGHSQTEFDGVFIVEKMVSGTYQLTIPESYLQQHRLSMSEPLTLTAKGDEGIFYLEPIQLRME